MRSLEESRKAIDEIDNQLIELFEKRMEISEDVVKYKMAHDMDIFQSKREEEVIEKNLKKTKNQKLLPYVKNFIIQNMNLSKRYQSSFLPSSLLPVRSRKEGTLIVGYQGVPGSFSNEALNTYFKDTIEVNYPHFEDVFKAIKQEEVDYGVLPLENSTTGAINDNYDLITQYGLYIVGEISLKISQHLLGLEEANQEDIKKVISHPQGLLQTSQYLKKHHIETESYPNTAMAAQFVASNKDKHLGAIASRKAAEIYGLKILAENIHNEASNYTRFMIVGRNLEAAKNATRISTIFTLPHEVGALFEVMQIIKAHQLNMARIESRPIPNKSWEYYFYLDIDGHLYDRNVQKALDELKACTKTFRVLGNYERQ